MLPPTPRRTRPVGPVPGQSHHHSTGLHVVRVGDGCPEGCSLVGPGATVPVGAEDVDDTEGAVGTEGADGEPVGTTAATEVDVRWECVAVGEAVGEVGDGEPLAPSDTAADGLGEAPPSTAVSDGTPAAAVSALDAGAGPDGGASEPPAGLPERPENAAVEIIATAPTRATAPTP